MRLVKKIVGLSVTISLRRNSSVKISLRLRSCAVYCNPDSSRPTCWLGVAVSAAPPPLRRPLPPSLGGRRCNAVRAAARLGPAARATTIESELSGD